MAKRPPEPEPAEAGTVFIFLKIWNSCQILYRPVSCSGAALLLSRGLDLPSLPFLHPEDNQGGCLASYLQHKVCCTCPSFEFATKEYERVVIFRLGRSLGRARCDIDDNGWFISKCAINNFKAKAHALTNVPLKPGVQASTLSYPVLIAAPSLTYGQGHTLYLVKRSLSFIFVRIIFLFTDKIKKFPQINIIVLLLSKSMIHFRVYRNTYLFTV